MTRKGVHCNPEVEVSVAKREIRTDTYSLFVAGVTFAAFWTIVSTLSKLNDEVLIVLVKLRQNLEIGILEKLFKMSNSYISKL